MQSFRWSWLVVVIVAVHVASSPVDKSAEMTYDVVENFGRRIRNDSGCYHKGAVHEEGQAVSLEDPCLSCTCRKGSLACHLQVCPDLPEPITAGCVVVSEKNRCCPQLLCEAENQENQIEVRTEVVEAEEGEEQSEGCTVNGSVYAEGSALGGSSLCEYCYCIKGQHRCIKPRCILALPGCTPSFREHSCCPTHYDCRSGSISKPSRHRTRGCYSGGVLYPEGDMVPSISNSSCENCYCMKGEVQCVPVTCTMDFLEDCKPVHTSEQCCPSSFICPKHNGNKSTVHPAVSNWISSFTEHAEETRGILTTNNGRSYQQVQNASTERPEVSATTEAEATSTLTADDKTTERFSTESTTEFGELEQTTSWTEKYLETEMQERIDHLESTTMASFQTTKYPDAIPETTTAFDEGTTLEPEETTTARISTTSVPIQDGNDVMDVTLSSKADFTVSKAEGNDSRAAPSAEDINSASHPDEEYVDYDYSEPRLPPSLPNLVIFPFVAADAVVKDQQTPSSLQSNKRADIGEAEVHKNFFSPPVETEGGFVPKESSEFDDTYSNQKGTSEITDRPSDIIPPSITMPPQLKSEHCFNEGREFRHGELISEAGECISCVCFYGEVICQEATCPTVKPGCRRIAEKEDNSCCGKVICDADELPVVSPVTIADTLDVTINPFGDVIRTEPAPDLPSLMSDMIPFYVDHQTKKPVSVTYKNVVVDYYPDYRVTTTRNQDKKTSEHKSVYYSTPKFGTKLFDKSKTPLFAQTTESLQNRIEHDFTVETTRNTTTTEETVSNATESLQKGTETAENVTEFVRTSIRPVVLKTTEPSRQTVNQTTPTIAHFKVRQTTKKPFRAPTKRPLVSIRPKPTRKATATPTSSEATFFDEFLKDFFESDDKIATTFSTTPTTITTKHLPTKHKYSSKIKSKPTTTAKPTTQNETKLENKNAVEDSFSLDSVLQILFNAETTTAPTVRVTNKPKHRNSTRKPPRRPVTRKTTKLPVRTTMKPTTEQIEASTKNVTVETTTEISPTPQLQSRRGSDEENNDLPFVTNQETGFPKIEILKQEEYNKAYVPTATTRPASSGHFPISSRKPTKTSQDLGGILKLAGCNIYGRMYRVGKIITELSGPCMECMCTDLGVQCAPLTCR